MKVLIVHPQMKLYGGAEVVVVRLAKYLQKQGHNVDIMTLSTAQHPDYKGLNFIVPPRSTEYRLRDGSFNTLKSVYTMLHDLRKLYHRHYHNYDVVNTHNFPSMWAINNKRKVVWMCNEVPDLWHSAKTSGLADKVFDVGRLTDRQIVRSRHFTAVVADLKCSRIFYKRYGITPTIVNYGIDGEFFADLEQNSYDGESDFEIIQPAMVSPSKEQMSVLQATDTMFNVHVTFAGYCESGHEYTKQLVSYARDRHISVAFTGQVSRGTLKRLYGNMHVAVFPGKGQGSWLGPFEALAAGRPVIVSPNLTCSSLIQALDIGIVTNDIKTAIWDVRRHYTMYKAQALYGRRHVLDSLTWDEYGRKMLEIFKS